MSTVYIRLAVPTATLAGALERAPQLERLLARADAQAESAPWRARALDVLGLGGVAPSAGLVQALRLGPVPEPWVLLATPVHLTAGHSSVALPMQGCLEFNTVEAQLLAADFNSVFCDADLRLAALPAAAGTAAQLLCLCRRPFDVTTYDPREALGGDVWEFQPRGVDAPRLRRLMSEIELWLFEHSLNRERSARGELPLTGLWLWAGGPSIAQVPAAQGFTGGDDAILSAIHPASEWPESPASGAVVLSAAPGSAHWSMQLQCWLVPAIEALRIGAVGELRLSLGRRCFSVRRSSWRRFWRRRHAWWEYLDHE